MKKLLCVCILLCDNIFFMRGEGEKTTNYALKWPQGEGRAIPNDSPYLAPPKRVQSKKEKEDKMHGVPILSAVPGLDKKK